MINENRRLEMLFDRLRDGDGDALIDFVELERPLLFDFLFRMSGQRDSVLRVLDETVVALKADRNFRADSVEDLRVAVYRTARSFCGHIWNADTSELVNEGYDGSEVDYQTLITAEKMLAVLPGWEREPVMLSFRHRFSIDGIAKIMSTSSQTVEDSIHAAVAKLSPLTKNDHARLLQHIRSIPSLPISVQKDDYGTVAISQIMGDIDQAKKKMVNVRKLIFFFLIIGISVLLYLGRDRF